MIEETSISNFPLFKKAIQKRRLVDLTLELTARCNNNCRHCYNNLPEGDEYAIHNELKTDQLVDIIDQAFNLGVLRILLTGGEVLLRKDFFEIYTYIKKKGFLVSVFTNGTLLTNKHIRIFKKYPPWNLEFTVYGGNRKEYAKVARKDNFSQFQTGLYKLIKEKIPFTLKTMVFKSNLSQIQNISDYCKKISREAFRYDPFLTLRTDRKPKKNKGIIQERLSASQIIDLEKSDPIRLKALKNLDNKSIDYIKHYSSEKLFQCNAGQSSCFISYDGIFRLCRPLVHSDCVYNLKKGCLKEAWETFTPIIKKLTSKDQTYNEKCGNCDIRNLCMWCPASADLETGQLDRHVDYFCQIAKKRHNICINS